MRNRGEISQDYYKMHEWRQDFSAKAKSRAKPSEKTLSYVPKVFNAKPVSPIGFINAIEP